MTVLARDTIFGLLLAAVLTQTALAETTIRVAVRDDAPPFASLEDTQASRELASYSGFAVDVCREIFERLPESYKVVAIRASVAQKFKVLDEGKADILCGPTSVTQKRLKDYVFTYPIFLSGVSVAVRSKRSAGLNGAPKIGMLSGTTALLGVRELQIRNSFGGHAKEVYNALDRINKGKPQDVVKSFLSYADGLSGLCRGEIDYFAGDIDIIANLAGSWTECSITVSRRTMTREIFAIVFSRDFVTGSSNDNGLSIFMQAQSTIFNMYQDGTYQSFFTRHFPKRKKSAELKVFFDSFRRKIDR
jgi:ABC-type amino acid transport substrate-binding protein